MVGFHSCTCCGTTEVISATFTRNMFCRIIADHGKEGRFPYLDENFVSFLSSLPLNIKVIFYLILKCSQMCNLIEGK